MDWNSYFEQWGATLGTYGVLIITALKTFVIDPINVRKTTFNLSSYKSLQLGIKGEIKAYSKVFVDGLDEFKVEVTQSVIEPLIKELKKRDNQQAIANDIIISLISRVNVPIAIKKETFENLSKLNILNKDVLNTLNKQIEVEENQEKETLIENKEVIDKLVNEV